ncbi:MAG: ABC transporter substrate-binding protein [Lachnospiraceae bacterium]|nr:ABC transporter substrate-binding protein [Lachnospiraceae bacterium]
MKKRIAACVLTGILAAATLAGCGSSTAETSDSETSVTETEETSVAETETDGTVYKVGIVNYVDDASLNQIVANIEAELDAKGEELGVTFEYEDYYENAQADSTVLNQIATDLVTDDVDVIVAIATPVAITMQTATEDTDIPVIFSAVTDPVGAGLVESMEEPGGNITGTSDALDTAAIMELMKAQNPDLSYIGLLYDTAQDSSEAAIQEAKDWCDVNGVTYIEKTGSTTDDVKLAAESLVAEGVEAIFTPTDNTIMTAELTIYETLAEAGIPHYCGADSFALNGAFCGYGVDYANLGVMTADMVVDLLVNGADPATTPVQTFDNGIASINTEICEQLGYDLDEIKNVFEPLCTEIVELQTAEEFE